VSKDGQPQSVSKTDIENGIKAVLGYGVDVNKVYDMAAGEFTKDGLYSLCNALPAYVHDNGNSKVSN